MDNKTYDMIMRGELTGYSRVIFAGFKYMFDRITALIALIILLPLYLIIAILIKLDDGGPVFFTQIRTGKKGKIFKLYKFRTMVKDNDVHDFSTKDKYTRIGKFLRKTSLDELPQITINVLKGDMSLIGPRPWITDYYDAMNEMQRHRYDVRPGLTGLAQCMGRNSISIFKKIGYDLEYIENYSLAQDIKIFFLTIKQVFSRSGSDAGKQTIEKELTALRNMNNK